MKEIKKKDPNTYSSEKGHIIAESLIPLSIGSNKRIYEIGFLVSLLLLVILQFLIFYFGIPNLAGSRLETSRETQSSIETAG